MSHHDRIPDSAPLYAFGILGAVLGLIAFSIYVAAHLFI